MKPQKKYLKKHWAGKTVRKIEWTPDGIDSLNKILEYYRTRAGESISNTIYDKIMKEIELLELDKIKTKRTQELTVTRGDRHRNSVEYPLRRVLYR